MRFFLATLALGLFSFSGFSQDEDEYDVDENVYGDIAPKHSFTIEVGLPVGTANKPFQSIMNGLVNTSPYYQFTLKNHLSFGIGGNYTFFRVNPVKTPEKASGGVHSAGAFIKVGYEKFHSMRFGTDFGIKAGYANSFFATDKNRDVNGGPVSVSSMYVEPTVGFVLTASEFTSYRFVVGYTFQGYDFHTSQLGISSNGGYKPADFDKSTQYMTFGFGFTYYFRQY